MYSESRLALRGERSGGSLRRIVAILFRRRRIVLLGFVATMAGVIAAVVITPARYEANLKILLERARVDTIVTPVTEVASSSQTTRLSPQEINSEVELLRSEETLRKVVIACKLHEKTPSTLMGRARRWMGELLKSDDRDRRIAKAVSDLSNALDVSPPNQSNLITIRYSHTNPKTAARVLNSLANFYLEKHIQVHRRPGTYEFFKKEVAESRQRLNEITSQLTAFAGKEGVVNTEAETTSTLSRLAEFEAELQTTDAAIAQTTERIRALRKQVETTAPRMTTAVRTSAMVVEQLKTTLFNLELKRTELLAKFAPTYRLVQDVDKQIALTKAAIAEAEQAPPAEQTTDIDPTYAWAKSELAKSQAELVSLRARGSALKRSVESYRAKALRLDALRGSEDELRREAKAAEQSYLLYVKKQEEARLSDALDRNQIMNVAIAQSAEEPALAISSPTSNLAMGFLLALVVSVGLSFIAEYFDPSLHTPEELEAYVDLPVLAAFPREEDQFKMLHSAGERDKKSMYSLAG